VNSPLGDDACSTWNPCSLLDVSSQASVTVVGVVDATSRIAGAAE
jgi:hypothetical protein